MINSEKPMSKIVRINRKSILITYEDGTYKTESIKSLMDCYLNLPIEHINNRVIVSFFENREQNMISDGIYRLYNNYFKIKAALEKK